MTLLELLTVIAVIAVLMAIAVPSFVSLTQTNRVAGEINALAGDLQFARAEAIKEGLPVSLCVANAAGTSCSNVTLGRTAGSYSPTLTGIRPSTPETWCSGTDPMEEHRHIHGERQHRHNISAVPIAAMGSPSIWLAR